MFCNVPMCVAGPWLPRTTWNKRSKCMQCVRACPRACLLSGRYALARRGKGLGARCQLLLDEGIQVPLLGALPGLMPPGVPGEDVRARRPYRRKTPPQPRRQKPLPLRILSTVHHASKHHFDVLLPSCIVLMRPGRARTRASGVPGASCTSERGRPACSSWPVPSRS